jgi:hypothetical protein
MQCKFFLDLSEKRQFLLLMSNFHAGGFDCKGHGRNPGRFEKWPSTQSRAQV